jgi:hypothetical protein
MKNLAQISLALAAALLLTTQGVKASPENTGRAVRIETANFNKLSLQDRTRVLEIKDRLEGILATDRATLRRSDRSAMRQEWKELKQEMKHYNAGGTAIYISTGGIIIIVLLLIILL